MARAGLSATGGSGGVVALTNGLMTATFDAASGFWVSLHRQGDAQSLVRRKAGPFDVLIEGRALWGDGPRKATRAERSPDGRSASFTFDKAGLRATHRIELAADLPLLRQGVTVRSTAGAPRRLTAVHYLVPGLAMGEPGDCLLQAPGQYLPPDEPYGAAAARPLDVSAAEPHPRYPQGWLESAPDQSPGLVAVENRRMARVAGVWQYSELATTFPTLDGREGLLDVGHRHQLGAWLRPGGPAADSDGHAILITEGTIDEHLRSFRRLAYGDRLAPRPDAPGWLAGARLLQIIPRDIAAWTRRLDQIAAIGFNVVYVTPVWHAQPASSYAIHDHFAIDPSVGTADEMKAFVAEAHGRGIRVLFDFIPQGIGDASPFIEQHRDWLVRDELGRPFGSHGWGPRPGEPPNGHTYSMDWGNPDYRRFCVDWALWNVREFDIDGFRCDAMHWKEPNFDPACPRAAWETMFGGLALAADLRQALKAARPDAVMLGEVWGPVFQRSCDAVYQNGWLLMQLNAGLLAGSAKMSARQWMLWQDRSDAARPAAALHACFTANHDTAQLADEARQSPLGEALSFMHAFSRGFPFIFHKELDGREPFFTQLLHHRASLSGYACSYSAAAADSPDVFAALWTAPGRPAVLAAANLSPSAVSANVALQALAVPRKMMWSSPSTSLLPAGQGLRLSLPAGGYALIGE